MTVNTGDHVRIGREAAIAIAEIGRQDGTSPTALAHLHSEIGAQLGFHRLVRIADDLARAADPYEGLALRRLKADLRGGQEELTRKILAGSATGVAPTDAIAAWIEAHAEPVAAVKASIDRIERSAGTWTLAKLLVAVSSMLNL